MCVWEGREGGVCVCGGGRREEGGRGRGGGGGGEGMGWGAQHVSVHTRWRHASPPHPPLTRRKGRAIFSISSALDALDPG